MASSGGDRQFDWRRSHLRTDNIRGGRGQGGRGGRGGRGGWNGAPKFKRDPPPKPDIVKYPLGELLQTFRSSDITSGIESLPAPKITDLQYVASYNWLDVKTPTILVPGRPPAWTPLKEPRKLNEDNGQFFRDPNGARFPSYPAEPAVQAILKHDPTFPISGIDIFACGSTMGNLLRFVRSSGKAFRFNVEVVGNTVFFVRKENCPKELIPNVKGYGHSFPEAYTTWEKDVKGSESHQRLVQYQFGELTCMVRFECDGYHKTSAPSNAQQHTRDKTSNDSDLSQAFEAASVSHAFAEMDDESLNVEVGGCEVPQKSIFDMKTRSGRFKTEIDMSDFLPVLWIKQIPNFIVAYHDGNGLFQDIRVQNIEHDIQAWERENEIAIKRLAVLLKKVTEIAKSDKRGLLEVYCPSDHLEIRRQHGEGSYCLPASLRAEWTASSEDSTDSSDHEESFGQGGVNISGTGGYTFPYDDEDEDDSDQEEKDYTACSVDCGYCGTCSY